ncbi:MAG TPA: polysaccharide biosynthesis/export family protein [Sphingobacteriaceae bacterium]
MRKGSKRTMSFHCIVLLALLVSSCANRYRNALFTSRMDSAADTMRSVFVVNGQSEESMTYRIRRNDILAVRNLQDLRLITPQDNNHQSQQQLTYRVDMDGMVTLPVVGRLPVAGMSRKEASDRIQSLYKQTLLKDPIIDVSVVNLKVTVLGEFTRQGNFLLEKENTTLIDIIGEAGGITPKANPGSLKIIRGERTNPEIIYVNLKDINSLSNPKLVLRNNDIIYMEPQGIYGTGERVQNFSTILQPVLLILNTALIIYNFTR